MRSWRVVLWLCILVTVTGGAVPAAAQPVTDVPPVAFTYGYCDGADEACPRGIWLRKSDGTLRQLTEGAGDRSPVWAPDGREIAFVRGGMGLFVIGSDGAGLRAVSHDVALSPTWSPDGRFIAFQRGRGGDQDFADELAIVPADGSPGRVLPTGVGAPSWSPDGSRIAVIPGAQVPADAVLLEVYDLAGRRVATGTGPDGWGADGTPAWSPDGATIAFGVKDAFGRHYNNRTLLVPSGGGGGRMLAEHDYLPNRRSWSPDGSMLTMATGSWMGPTAHFEVHVVAPDGTVRARTTGHDEAEMSPVWLQDGRRVAYHRLSIGPDGEWLSELLLDSAALDAPRVVLDRLGDWDIAPQTVRLSGSTRVETAAAVSRAVRTRADTVIVAPAASYAAALLAAPLAGRLDAPVLLSPGAGLSPAAAEEVRRLRATNAVLMDPLGALSAQVEADLRTAGVTGIRRIGGGSVFAAAAAVAGELPGDHVYVVEGASPDPLRGWPDAVSVSALAAHGQIPVLLVERDRLPPETRDALRDGGRARVTIIGGSAAVSAGVEQQLRDLGVAVDRLFGATRYDTSRAVANASVAAGLATVRPWVVTGTNYPDALAAGPAAAASGAALVLVDGRTLTHSPATAQWLAAAAPGAAVLVGGTAAISPVAATQVAQQLR